MGLHLVSTSDLIKIVTAQDAAVDVYASWTDFTAPNTFSPGTSAQLITVAGTVTAVAAPGASVKRTVNCLSIRNTEATASVDVTVQYTDGSTTPDLYVVTLAAGEALYYEKGTGFFVSTVPNPALRTIQLASDVNISSATPAEVTGLSVLTGVGTFYFKYYILYQSTAAGTGIRLSVNHAGTVTSFVAQWHFVDATATAATAAADQDAVGAAGQVFSAFAARAKSVAGWGTSISVDTANADMLAIVEGMMVVTVDGNIELWYGSEGAVQTTLKAGSMLVLGRAA